MLAPDTPANETLSKLLNDRIRADTRSTIWRALGYRAAGVAGFVLLLGAGVALAGFGVAAVVKARPDPDAVARRTAAIVRAGSVVTVRGTVEASGEVALAAGQAVGLEKGSAVALAPDAKV